mmetsp:Transcript_34900/g.116641  ORF Transcript_34900/g.116641 Transcript_34900/m.116641 type:complete len:187 (+) Transcript_34900:70-630(+)
MLRKLNPPPPSAQAISIYGIDVPKLDADYFVPYKAVTVKIKNADGTLHPASTNLGFFNDALHVKLKDIILEQAGEAIKTDAVKGRHIVTARNPTNETFSIDIKASLAPHLDAVLAKNSKVDIAAHPPADSSRPVLLCLNISRRPPPTSTPLPSRTSASKMTTHISSSESRTACPSRKHWSGYELHY